MPRVVHFEIFADDPQRACDFYTKVFAWKAHKWGEYEYWYLKTGEESELGINGGILKRSIPLVNREFRSCVCTINVSNVDEYVKRVEDAYGAVAVPKSYLPGVGYLVYCFDTEGNMFGMMQDEKK